MGRNADPDGLSVNTDVVLGGVMKAWSAIGGGVVNEVCNRGVAYTGAYSFMRSRQPFPIHTAGYLLLERQEKQAIGIHSFMRRTMAWRG